MTEFKPKAPTYTPSEIATLAAADRVVVRKMVAPGQWHEVEFPAAREEVAKTLRDVCARIAGFEKTDPNLRALVYVGGIVDGELRLVSADRKYLASVAA